MREITSQNYQRLAHYQRKSDQNKRIVSHGKLNIKDKPIHFRAKQIHSSKILIKGFKNFVCVGYWYLEEVSGFLLVSHGDTEQKLKELAKIYFNQFKKRLS